MITLHKLLFILDFPLIITGKLIPNSNILFYLYFIIFLTTFVELFVSPYDPETLTMGTTLVLVCDFIYKCLAQICQLRDRFFIKARQRIFSKILTNFDTGSDMEAFKIKALVLLTSAILLAIVLIYVDFITYVHPPGWINWIERFLMAFRIIWFLFIPIKFYLFFSLVNNKLCGLIESTSYDQKLKVMIYSCFECYNDLFRLCEQLILLHVTLLFTYCPLTYFAVKIEYVWEYLVWNALKLGVFVVMDHLISRTNTLVSTRRTSAATNLKLTLIHALTS